MDSPYIRKYADMQGFAVWLVDGMHIRKEIDQEFTNFGHSFLFPFIPENELWIDQEYGSMEEAKYFAKRMLVEIDLFKNGKSKDIALHLGNLVEAEERAKEIKMPEDLYSSLKIAELGECEGNVKFWLINGCLVRTFIYQEFTHGGHDRIYSFVPEGEIWIDDSTHPEEREYIILHEIHERNLMLKGMHYEKAHMSASKVENMCIKNPGKLSECLMKELVLSGHDARKEVSFIPVKKD